MTSLCEIKNKIHENEDSKDYVIFFRWIFWECFLLGIFINYKFRWGWERGFLIEENSCEKTPFQSSLIPKFSPKKPRLKASDGGAWFHRKPPKKPPNFFAKIITDSSITNSHAEINILSGLNVVLKERHEIESNYNHLHLKMEQLKKDELERREKVRFANFYPKLQ